VGVDKATEHFILALSFARLRQEVKVFTVLSIPDYAQFQLTPMRFRFSALDVEGYL